MPQVTLALVFDTSRLKLAAPVRDQQARAVSHLPYHASTDAKLCRAIRRGQAQDARDAVNPPHIGTLQPEIPLPSAEDFAAGLAGPAAGPGSPCGAGGSGGGPVASGGPAGPGWLQRFWRAFETPH